MSSHGDDDIRYTMWRISPRILTMPTVGWEMVASRGPKPEIAVLRFLLPLSLAAAGSEFFAILYKSELSFTSLLVQAVIIFSSFFIGYYLSLVLAKIFLPRDAKDFPSTPYGKLLIMTGVASLAFFMVLEKALPMVDFILEFLPLWTVYILYKGMTMVVVSGDKQTFSIGVICVVVISSPVIVEWFLSLFA